MGPLLTGAETFNDRAKKSHIFQVLITSEADHDKARKAQPISSLRHFIVDNLKNVTLK